MLQFSRHPRQLQYMDYMPVYVTADGIQFWSTAYYYILINIWHGNPRIAS